MRTSKEGGSPVPSKSSSVECCMCGDYGLSYELFKCQVCKYRSQHRYCSVQYPNADSYSMCNWCFSQKEGILEKPPNSSSSFKKRSDIEKKIKKRIGDSDHQASAKDKKGLVKLQVNNSIKKHRSPERSPPSAARKRITVVAGGGGGEEKLRRSRLEENPKKNIKKLVIRNKVRRYKLLDEVSS